MLKAVVGSKRSLVIATLFGVAIATPANASFFFLVIPIPQGSADTNGIEATPVQRQNAMCAALHSSVVDPTLSGKRDKTWRGHIAKITKSNVADFGKFDELRNRYSRQWQLQSKNSYESGLSYSRHLSDACSSAGLPLTKAQYENFIGYSVKSSDAKSLVNPKSSSSKTNPQKTLLDQGLDYDISGVNLTAQQYYLQLLTTGPNDEATRRLAISFAITGQANLMEGALNPLISKGDKASQRAYALSLAILGRTDEAVAFAKRTVPSVADKISPYMRYMPRLTRAQKVAAANFGRFPLAKFIGQEEVNPIGKGDPEFSSYFNEWTN